MIYKIKIINYASDKKLLLLKKKWNIINDNNAKFALVITKDRIELKNQLNTDQKNLWVDFTHKKMQLYQNDKTLKIIKAVGIKKNSHPNIIDGTAGFGKDSFIFFSHGCHVTMIERHPIISILLYDGLKRSYQNDKIKHLTRKRMNFIYNTTSNIEYLNIKKRPDVIYLDPMFPKKIKTAASKKNIKIIQNLVGYNTDANILLPKCISFTKKKVVVKRPKKSNYFANIKPNYIFYTKKYRFDVYSK